jgi:hypothetical protein
MSTVVKKEVTTGYSPRPLQFELHRKAKRFSVVVCHRRWGKTVWAINHMIAAGLRCERDNPRYAYLAPFYSQVKRVCWDYLKKFTSTIPGVTVNEADLRVDIPRPGRNDCIRFQLLGADNPVSLKGIYLDGVVMDEYGDMNPMTWREVIRPTLSDRLGWAIFIGTPKGQNSFYELYDRALHGFPQEDGSRVKHHEWFAALYKASETKIIPDSELESARLEMTESEYNQEFECSFLAGLVGAYFSKEMERAERENRITHVPSDDALTTDTYWDLGINDTTVVWFVQTFGMQYRIIDHLETCGSSLPEVIKMCREKPYVLGAFNMPHDIKVRELTTGKSRYETLWKLGVRNIRIIPKTDKRDQINAARMILSRCWFDKANCDKGIKALQNYKRKWNAKNNVFEDQPLHDWASNSSDAFQQFAIGVREQRDSSMSKNQIKCETDYPIFGRGVA